MLTDKFLNELENTDIQLGVVFKSEHSCSNEKGYFKMNHLYNVIYRLWIAPKNKNPLVISGFNVKLVVRRGIEPLLPG